MEKVIEKLVEKGIISKEVGVVMIIANKGLDAENILTNEDLEPTEFVKELAALANCEIVALNGYKYDLVEK